MICFWPLHCVFLISFLTSYLFIFFPAHSICPHWCSCSFSNMPNSLPPHSLPPYYFFSLPRISFPFVCKFSFITHWHMFTCYLIRKTSQKTLYFKTPSHCPFLSWFEVLLFLQITVIWCGTYFIFWLILCLSKWNVNPMRQGCCFFGTLLNFQSLE